MKIPYPKIVSEIFHNLHNLQVEENSGYFHHLIRNDSMYAERIVDAGLFLERKGAICKKENVCKYHRHVWLKISFSERFRNRKDGQS